MMNNFRLQHTFVGVDLHKETHTAVILNCFNEKLSELTIDNKPSDFDKLIKWAYKHSTEGTTPVFGLEDVGGYGRSLAVHLVEREEVVKEVNSSLSADKRKRKPIQKKSDSIDAQCVAMVLITDFNDLPDANPNDIYWTIKQTVNRRDSLVKVQTALKDQLHNQLMYSYPSYKKFFSELCGKGALAFWEKYPSPKALAGVSVEELTMFLRASTRNALSTKKAIAILDLVKEDGDTTRGYQDNRDFLVQSIVRDLKFKQEEIALVEAELTKLMAQTDYQLETMPEISIVTASQLVAEIGDINRFKNPNKLAMYAGIAPVTFSSGSKDKNVKCNLGNRKLHGIFYFMAVRQTKVYKGKNGMANPMIHAYYEKKKAEGKSSNQALVCVMRRLVNIIFGMMKTKTAYRMPALQEVA